MSDEVKLEFVCTDRGSHAPVKFGSCTYEPTDDRVRLIRSHFSRPEKTKNRRDRASVANPDEIELAVIQGVVFRLDDQCPRCRRHPKYSQSTLRRMADAAIAAGLAELTIDVSSPEFP